MRLGMAETAEAAGGRLIYEGSATEVTNICLDSRKLGSGDLFVPVIGERTDAHRFLAVAAESGAACALTSRHGSSEELMADEELWHALHSSGAVMSVIYVEDTVRGLQSLGAWYRRHRVHMPVVAVTGSVGKTTTREMTACALSPGRRVFATKGNLNSQVGVPMTVTSMEDEDVAVLELGVSMPGEMEKIARVAAPDTVIMTNIGISHIEYLGSRENILREKLRIVTGSDHPVRLIVNGDNDLLSGLDMGRLEEFGISRAQVSEIIACGSSEGCDVRMEGLKLEGGLPSFIAAFYRRHEDGSLEARPWLRQQLSLSVPGEHLAMDALLALAAAVSLGTDPEAAARSLEGFSSLKGRGAIREKDGMTIIDDSYNAAPDSMKAALRVLMERPAEGRHIAVLADMKELGDGSRELHREIGRFMASMDRRPDMVLLLGPEAALMAQELGELSEVRLFEDTEGLEKAIADIQRKGDVILFKGSNSMGLSRVVDALYGGA